MINCRGIPGIACSSTLHWRLACPPPLLYEPPWFMMLLPILGSAILPETHSSHQKKMDGWKKIFFGGMASFQVRDVSFRVYIFFIPVGPFWLLCILLLGLLHPVCTTVRLLLKIPFCHDIRIKVWFSRLEHETSILQWLVAIGGFQNFTWEMLGNHMKFQSLMVKLEILCIPKHCTPSATLHSFKENSLARSPPHPPNPKKQSVLTLKIRQTTSIHQQEVNKNIYRYIYKYICIYVHWIGPN